MRGWLCRGGSHGPPMQRGKLIEQTQQQRAEPCPFRLPCRHQPVQHRAESGGKRRLLLPPRHVPLALWLALQNPRQPEQPLNPHRRRLWQPPGKLLRQFDQRVEPGSIDTQTAALDRLQRQRRLH